MLSRLKRRLYFVVASYFAFWAKFVLRRWQPRVVVVTGSSGKTTVLHMVEAQLGDQAIYTHHANSSIGLPFFMLGMSPNASSLVDWVGRFVTAPFRIFRSLPSQKILIAEADADRIHEGEFIAKFLRPEVTLWVSVYRTHSMGFDPLVLSGKFETHEQAIAYEFGWFAEMASKLVLTNSDQPVIVEQLDRVQPGAKTITVNLKDLKKFVIESDQTAYTIGKQVMHLQGLHPRELSNSIRMVEELSKYLKLPFDPDFTKPDRVAPIYQHLLDQPAAAQ